MYLFIPRSITPGALEETPSEELSPNGTYVKMTKLELVNLGNSFRRYFKGFDKEKGTEIIWATVTISGEFVNYNGVTMHYFKLL